MIDMEIAPITQHNYKAIVRQMISNARQLVCPNCGEE